MARLAAAELLDQERGDLGAPIGGVGVEAALEAVAGVGDDAEPAPGRRRADRVEQRDLEEDVGGLLGAARELAAHDAANALDALVVGDHGHLGIERVGLAVERQDLFSVARHAHGQVAGQLVGVEHVERAAQVEGHQVGDVDQRGDRPEPDGLEPVLQPLRAGAVLHVAEKAADHAGTGGLVGQVAQPLDRALEAALDGHRGRALEGAQAGGGEIAGDAEDAQAVAPVRRDGDLDHRVVEAEDLGEGRADLGVLGQVDDALVLVGQAHLALRDQHAVGLDTADHALLEVDPGAWDVTAGGGEDALHAGARVGRAADHLDLFRAGVDDADPQAVGVGVLLRLPDVGDREGRQLPGAVLHALDLEADHRELVGDLLERGLGLQVLLEPGERELHRHGESTPSFVMPGRDPGIQGCRPPWIAGSSPAMTSWMADEPITGPGPWRGSPGARSRSASASAGPTRT